MNVWGQSLKLSIFGQSHGPAIGLVLDGIPAGEEISLQSLAEEMARRAPGRSEMSTARRESDEVEILSGLVEGRSCGAPICGLIRNRDAISKDYSPVLRPGHADWTAWLKYKGWADMRGGGHFSGRLTAPLVAAGAIAKQVLARRGVEIYARIKSVATIEDPSSAPALAELRHLKNRELPIVCAETARKIKQAIAEVKAEGDSVGGVVEIAAHGVPAGLGEPFFASAESVISSLLFSIGGVKGVEFGDGFGLSALKGSQANDELELADGRVRALSNHNGGILGGISCGEPMLVRVAVKPTPSIARPQRSVDPGRRENVELKIKGRHDPCIVPRAVVVMEAALALAILDLALSAQASTF